MGGLGLNGGNGNGASDHLRTSGGAGGGGAKGTSAGGGGGSGSSTTSGMSNTSIAERYGSEAQQTSANGAVTVTWQDV